MTKDELLALLRTDPDVRAALREAVLAPTEHTPEGQKIRATMVSIAGDLYTIEAGKKTLAAIVDKAQTVRAKSSTYDPDKTPRWLKG